MTDRELMQQALDVINSECGFGGSNEYDPWAIAEALRERLAQPEQEPVAWVVQYAHDHKDIDFYEPDIEDLPVGTKLYTSPPASKPLTDEQLEAMAEKYVTNCYFDTLKYARAIEAAHGITGEQK